ncbi:MAG TPA: DNA-processing protein DprA [Candidatus Omnitrophota bacterium]|nr:DNA-processing protein DprA [Candidatus Omnitrophota bacterium]
MDPLDYQNLKALLFLNRLKLEGRRQTVALLGEGKSPSEIVVQLQNETLFQVMMATGKAQAFDPDQEIDQCTRKGIRWLPLTDPEYPPLLKEIPDPPILLYKKGEILPSDQNALAIVGTRHPSFYGRTQAKKFAQELSSRGLTIVSGLARGIDQVAHEAALQVSYGRTIAVMGCGLDVIYPKENATLYGKIVERGAVFSEYPLGTPPLPENFPRRNRILSGLSYGVFVVEAHSRSGSLITAHQALEQNREVFALPGPVDQLTSRGTHQLLKEGAYLVENSEDIVEILALRLGQDNLFKYEVKNQSSVIEKAKSLFSSLVFPKRTDTNKPLVTTTETKKEVSDQKETEITQREIEHSFSDRENSLTDEAHAILEALQEEGALSREDILDVTGLEPSQVPSVLLQLELNHKVQRSHDGKYVLKQPESGPSGYSDSHQK